MTRNNRSTRLGAALLGVIAAACWLAALLTAGRMTEQYDALSVRFPAASVTQKDLERAAAASTDAELLCKAAWTRGSELKKASAALGESTQVRMIDVYGDMRQIAPMTLLNGSFPVDDDSSGCVIDTKSAWNLFHSTDAIGAELTVDGNPCVVRGIVEAYEPMVIMRNSDAVYENLEFTARDLSAAKQLVETFLYRCNSDGDYIVVQSGLLAHLALGSVWLLACIFGVAGACAFWKNAWTRKKSKRDCVLFFLAGAVLIVASAAVLMKTAYWPQSFLPTKWSDFGFWSTLLHGWEAQWKAISLITPLPKEIVFFQQLRCCGVLLLTALLTAGWCTASLRMIGKWRD